MKINFFLLAFVVMLIFVNCSKDNSIEQDIGKEVKVTATFSGMSVSSEVTTRVTDTSWEKDDAIGLFMMNSGVSLDESALASNVKYINSGSKHFTNSTESKIYFPVNKDKVDFIAYYPFNENLNGFFYPIDLSNQICQSSIDLMYSDSIKGVTFTDGELEFDLKHQLTKVIIKIKTNKTDNPSNTFDEVKISNVYKKASFLLSDGKISNQKDNDNIIFKLSSDNKIAEAILLPTAKFSRQELLVTIGGIEYSCLLNSLTEIDSFDMGTKCEFDINIDYNEDRILNNVTTTITDWIIIKDELTVTEVIPDEDNKPTEPDNGDNNDGGDGDANSGEEGSKDDSGDSDSGDIEPDPGAELGSQQNPYTIAGISTISDMTDAKDIWVKGFIVGSYNDIGVFYNGIPTVLNGSVHNLALADSRTEKKAENTFPVDINVNNDNTLTSFLEVLNLKDNPSNLKKEVLVRGDIGDWLPGTSVEYKRPAIVNLKEAFLEGKKL